MKWFVQEFESFFSIKLENWCWFEQVFVGVESEEIFCIKAIVGWCLCSAEDEDSLMKGDKKDEGEFGEDKEEEDATAPVEVRDVAV